MTIDQAGIPRRRFLQLAAVAGGAMLVPVRFPGRALAGTSPQVLLPGSRLPQFVDPLPSLHATAEQVVSLEMRELRTRVLPTGAPVPGYQGTMTWSYRAAGQPDGGTYVGPLVVAERGTPTTVTYVNALGSASTTQVRAYRDSTDQTLHWADPLGTGTDDDHYEGPVPAVPHLHGGEVPPELDGGPDAWFTSDGEHAGPDAYGLRGDRAVYRYPNTQEGAPLWFHDHTLGATRLNVYAGLAGAYLLTDPAHEPPGLPPLVPLVVQDRMFDTDGELLFPAGAPDAPNPDVHPYWVPEFVGDTIVVNGKVWPFLAVERRRYRFLLLNGSNARTYELFLTDPVTGADGPPMWVIGTDGGYLDAPVKVDPGAKGGLQRLVVMPGERYQVIVDFADPTWRRRNPRASGSLVLRNLARTPFPNGTPAQGSTVGRILRFQVAAEPVDDTSYDPDPAAGGGGPLRTDDRIVRLVDPGTGRPAPGVSFDLTRALTLNEAMGPGGPLEVLVNNTPYAADASELPHEGDTELWEIVNITADAHPIHLHLVQFQVMDRQAFDVRKYVAAYDAAFPGGGHDHMTGQPFPAGVYVPGFGPPLPYAPSPASGGKHGGNPDVTPFLRAAPAPPPAYEAGWKDTVVAYPGQVTRIVVRWAPTHLPVGTARSALVFPFDPGGQVPGESRGYVWHCHIIDHEDNEMMRPTRVTPTAAVTRTVTDY